ncbi:hypothetical protein Tco_0025371 [Tanacetum coccineum]
MCCDDIHFCLRLVFPPWRGVTPLATKPPIIVEYKIVKEGQKGFYHLIRVDGSSNRYSSMIRMLQNISREDLETLWKLVKTKHGNTRPEDVYEKVFWGDLKVMFEPDIKSEIWRSLQGYKVTVWKLFDSSGVHFVRFKNLHIFMLVEKRYPLTPITITNMLNKKLQADYWNEMCYQLLKLMIQKMNIKFRGGLLGLKDFKMILRVTTAQICPKVPGHKFVDPPFEEEILFFMSDLGYPSNIKSLSEVKVEILPQPWRTFRTIINKCLSGKVTGLDLLRLSRAQIL